MCLIGPTGADDDIVPVGVVQLVVGARDQAAGEGQAGAELGGGCPARDGESVFVVVAVPQASGTSPKRSSPLGPTLSVVCDPAVIVAVTALVLAS